MHTSTTLREKRLIAYVYNFYARGNLCVRGMSFARKRLIVYVYVFCARGELCIRGTSFVHQLLMLQGISCLHRRGDDS